jgi:hypothetical protein
VTELEDLVEHMPARGGCFGSLFGWSDKDLARYRAEIEAVIRSRRRNSTMKVVAAPI